MGLVRIGNLPYASLNVAGQLQLVDVKPTASNYTATEGTMLIGQIQPKNQLIELKLIVVNNAANNQ